ncbi:methyltransferase 15, partial [Paramuricea clavata]
MQDAFTTHEIPWNNCVSFGVDNTSVNMGCRNSIKSRVLDMNPAIYIVGCPCHVVHNTALKVANAFEETSRFNVEDTVINIYYWFDKSTKRKASL